MIRLSHQEASFMRKNGYEAFVKQTRSNKKTYYLVEEQNNVYKYNPKAGKRTLVRLSALNMLKKYHKSVGITD